MWLSKPIYEALPYYYVALGAAALLARPYLDWWYWPAICVCVGVLCIAAGLFVIVQRRRSRRSE